MNVTNLSYSPFLSTWFRSVKCIHIVIQPISRTLCLAKQTLYQFFNSSQFPPPLTGIILPSVYEFEFIQVGSSQYFCFCDSIYFGMMS